MRKNISRPISRIGRNPSAASALLLPVTCILILLIITSSTEARPVPPERWQFIDHTGKVVIPPRTGITASAFHEGLARLCFLEFSESGNAMWEGFIDRTGSWSVVPVKRSPGLRHFGRFSEGFAARSFQSENRSEPLSYSESFGYINRHGKTIVAPYREKLSQDNVELNSAAFPFSDGVALVVRDVVMPGRSGPVSRKYLFIDRSGAEVFSLGKEMEAVEPATEDDLVDESVCGELGVDDRESCERAKKGSSFCEGFSLVRFKSKFGFVGKSGKWLCWGYDSALPFSEGLAFVRRGEQAGFIDTTGKMAIELPPVSGLVGASFHEGLCKQVRVWERGKSPGPLTAYIDKTGTTVISLNAEQLAAGVIQPGDFSGGLAMVRLKSGAVQDRIGYIDKTGKWRIPPRPLRSADSFADGVARIMFDDSKGGYIDLDGKVIWQSDMFLGTRHSEGLMGVAVP